MLVIVEIRSTDRNVTAEPYAKSVKMAPKDTCMDMTLLQIVP